MLMQHRQENMAWERECAALAGYCAGLATALARNGKLGSFESFYEKTPKPNAGPPPSTEDHIRMMRERGEGGPPN